MFLVLALAMAACTPYRQSPAEITAALKAANPSTYEINADFETDSAGNATAVQVTISGSTIPINLLPLARAGSVNLSLSQIDATTLMSLKGVPVRELRISDSMIPDISFISNIPIERLELLNCPKISDISPLKNTHLKAFRFPGCPGIKDMSALRGLPLESLHVNDEIVDLSPIAQSPLRAIAIGKAVSDLSPLRGKALEDIGFSDHSCISDLSPLEGSPLQTFNAYACIKISDISALRHARLKKVNFEGTSISDLSPLRGQPIEYARICTPLIEDVSPLSGMPLRELDLTYARGLRDILILEGMDDMRDLRLDFTSISSISALKNMKKLRVLGILNCPNLHNISVIADLNIEALIFTPENFPPDQIAIIRQTKSLKWIDSSWAHWNNSYSYDPKIQPTITAEQFWSAYDEAHAANSHQ